MKKSTLLFFFVILLLGACRAPEGDIYILYDNDVHCAIEGYEKMAALRADYLKRSIYVNVVSCGDFVQGSKVGSVSKGKYPVSVMNAVQYDYVTLGNHEFDYGIPQMKKLMRSLHAQCLCCNLTYVPTGKDLFAGSDIRHYGSQSVAFIGVATPTSPKTSVPTHFMNDKGELDYDFHEEEVVALVQKAVNAVRQEKVDRVIVLSHLGDDTQGINSNDLIQQTIGIDAVLDGHAHHVINTKVANLDGDSILLTSTGYNFQYVGCLHIVKDAPVQNELIDLNHYNGTNDRVRECIESITKKVQSKTSRYIGFSEVTLTDKDDKSERLVRKQETNLGDFAADALRVVAKADIGVCNGGGLRCSLPAGKVSYGDLLQVFPFNNTLYKIKVSGQQLLDALAIGISKWPLESGDFLHVSGLRYVVDTSDNHIVSAEVQRDTTWQPVAVDSVYTVGGQNYMLVCGGASGMFDGTESLPIDHILDVEVLVRYIKLLGDTIHSEVYDTVQQRIQFINE